MRGRPPVALVAVLLATLVGCGDDPQLPTDPVDPVEIVPPLGPPPPGGFEISLTFVDSLPAAHRLRVEEAAWYLGHALWPTRTVPVHDVWMPTHDDPCGNQGGPTRVVNGLLIAVRVANIDALARAGPCSHRPPEGLPLVGAITINPNALSAKPDRDFGRLIRHEMLHILGIGTHSRWHSYVKPSAFNTGWYFEGPRAIAAFDSAIGGYHGDKVPLTRDLAHWRHPVIRCDVLMNWGCPAGVVAPTTILTLSSLIDIGWDVDLSLAEPPIPR